MQFSVSLKILDEMLLFVRKEAKRLAIPAKAIHKMELACEEAIVNIISHAHPKDDDLLSIECSLLDATHFDVMIKDQGPPFNPLEAPIDPQKNKTVSERKIGGLGIYLIRKLIDEAVYKREENENVLHLTLRLEVPEQL